LVPLDLEDSWIEEIRASLPELPHVRYKRFLAEYGLSEDEALTLTSEKELADFFEQSIALGVEPKKACNWILSEVLRLLNEKKIGLSQSRFTPELFFKLLGLIEKGVISGKIAKNIFEPVFMEGLDPEKYVKEKGLIQISNTGELEGIVEAILAKFPQEVERFQQGEKKLLGFFVGQVMRATQGKANPQLVNSLLLKKMG